MRDCLSLESQVTTYLARHVSLNRRERRLGNLAFVRLPEVVSLESTSSTSVGAVMGKKYQDVLEPGSRAGVAVLGDEDGDSVLGYFAPELCA